MPTVHFDSPSERAKIALAREYGDRVKALSYSYNEEVERVWKKYLPSLRLALSMGEDTGHILDAIIFEMRALLSILIDEAVNVAVEREAQEEDTAAYYLIPFEVEQCNINYYEDALAKYREILELDLIIAGEMGFADELEMFLYNPLAFLAGDTDGLIRLKNEVPAGQGVSYSFFENMKKIGISAAALSYCNALHHIWKSEGDVLYYYGVRNSNYPCALCDGEAYMLHRMDEGMIYPLHNRCVCSVIPLRQSDMF